MLVLHSERIFSRICRKVTLAVVSFSALWIKKNIKFKRTQLPLQGLLAKELLSR